MISFIVDTLFVLDLRDDFIMNENDKLYDFIGLDPVKAFHLGIRVQKWFDLLDKKQQYLHSKLLRHNKESIEQYSDQIKYWTNQFPSEEGQVDMIEMSEYLMDKIVWNSETEEQDKVRVALFLGMLIGQTNPDEEDELLFGVH